MSASPELIGAVSAAVGAILTSGGAAIISIRTSNRAAKKSDFDDVIGQYKDLLRGLQEDIVAKEKAYQQLTSQNNELRMLNDKLQEENLMLRRQYAALITYLKRNNIAIPKFNAHGDIVDA